MGGESTTLTAPKAKRAHTKSRNGCKNCKARKVKCDERRPLCKNCQKHYSNITECEWETEVSRPPPPPPRAHEELPARPVDILTEEVDPVGQRAKLLAALNLDSLDTRYHDSSETLPPGDRLSVEQFVREYLETQPSASFPFFTSSSIMRAWWPFARDDIVLFHVMLVLGDRNLKPNVRVQDSEKVRRMLGLTIALLKERLQDPILGIKDETIVTVAHLAAIEHERGDNKTLKLHLSGLKRMVTMRGGLDALKASCPLIANFIAWVGLLTANDPYLVPSELQFQNEEDYPDRLKTKFDATNFEFDTAGIEPEVITTVATVNVLAQHFNSVLRNKGSMEEMSGIINAVTLTVQKLLRYAKRFDSYSPTDALNSGCCLAASMHLIAPVGGKYPDSSFTLRALQAKLKAKLSILIDADVASSALIYWMLYAGGVTATDPGEREWFVRHLALLSKDLGIHDWVTARETCAFTVWHAVYCEIVFARLWFDIEEKMKTLDFWNERIKFDEPEL